MSKAAFIILAAGDAPESLGRIVNALMGALEFTEAGGDVKIIFDGAGTQGAAALAARITNITTFWKKCGRKSPGYAVTAPGSTR